MKHHTLKKLPTMPIHFKNCEASHIEESINYDYGLILRLAKHHTLKKLLTMPTHFKNREVSHVKDITNHCILTDRPCNNAGPL